MLSNPKYNFIIIKYATDSKENGLKNNIKYGEHNCYAIVMLCFVIHFKDVLCLYIRNS